MTSPEIIVKPIAAIFGIFSLWIADTVVPAVGDSTGWISILREIGIPTAMLLLAIYALSKVTKELKDSQDARIADAKATLELYRQDAAKADSTRQELIREMRIQTDTIKNK